MKTFPDFQAEVKSGKMRNVFLIAASDSYFISKGSELLREKVFGNKNNIENYFVRYGDDSSIDEIQDLANNTSSLFSEQKIIVLKRAEKYSRKNKELFEALRKIDFNTFMLVVFDREYVLEKKFEKDSEFFDFSDFPEVKLKQFIRTEFETRGFAISDENLEYFISSVPQSIDLLLTEIEKITNYDFEGLDKTITKDLILKFIGYDKEYSPEELISSILAKDSRTSLEILNGLSSSAGFSEIYLLSIMGNYYMDLLTFKTRGFEQKDSGALWSKYKIWGDRVKIAKKFANSININSLELSFNKILDTDLKLKTSMLDSKILMTSLVEELVNA